MSQKRKLTGTDLGLALFDAIFGNGEMLTDKEFKESLKELKDFNGRVYLKIPTIIKEEFEIICNLINENLENVEGIITANAGIINRFKDKTKILHLLNLYLYLISL